MGLRLLNVFVALILTFGITVNSYGNDSKLAGLFQDRNLNGTMIISSLDGKITYCHNRSRSEERFSPASTFKILNSLIALKEKAIENESEVIRWDGKDRGRETWNQDQTLEMAFPLSCVWFYQELAKRVGNATYLDHLKKIGYGNEKTGPDLTTFWLDGNLKISAIEQINFLKKLYDEKLPYETSHMRLVKRLMIVEEKPQYIMRAKTGWAGGISPQQGWYVGYVETNGQVWFFATNLEIKRPGDEAFRQEITREALKAKGII